MKEIERTQQMASPFLSPIEEPQDPATKMAYDVMNGKFDSVAQMGELIGELIGEGETFTFAFTKVGEYLYRCEPHPHMQGRIEIVENYS